jgi:dihydroorotate dehydrogenase electron transfer subunit
MIDTPKSVRIKKIMQETPLVRSYVFDFPLRAKPGQFVMLWIPGIDEKPLSIAGDDGKSYTLAAAAVGPMTKELANKKVGDYVGVRGPYGTNFSWKPKSRIAMLAGGYGAAPLYFAAARAVREGCKVDFYHGARGKEHLMFADRIKKLKNVKYLAATDDGSVGFKGRNVDCWLEQMKSGTKYDLVMTCGPEIMMKKIAEIAKKKKIAAQISVERYMKCGFGICGNCCVDDSGIRTCQKGPIMELKDVLKIKEFGMYHRDNLGKKIYYPKM